MKKIIKNLNGTPSVLNLLGLLILFSLLLFNLSNIIFVSATNVHNDELSKSFNAEGTINTSLDSQDLVNKQSFNNVSSGNSDVNVSEGYVLGGKWRLDVINNNVTYFKANLTMMSTKGQGEHFHVIVYKPVTSGISLLASNSQEHGKLFSNPGNNTISFSGSVDIVTNGVLQWRDVPMITSIYNNKVLTIYLDKIAINNHFLDKDIFGLVNSVEPILNASKAAS
jgi:hypothetical protein